MVCILVISTIFYKSLCPLALLHCCYKGLCWESPREQTVNLSSPPIHHPASCLCHLIYPDDQEKICSFNYKWALCLQNPSQVRQHTKTSARQYVSVVVLVAISKRDGLDVVKCWKGWNLRCGVLFLSETILIMLPSTPPTKPPSNRPGKRSQFVKHTLTCMSSFLTSERVCARGGVLYDKD